MIEKPLSNRRTLSDDDLVQLVKRRDHRAYGELWQRHHKVSIQTAFSILGRLADAQEVVQESWLSVWLHIDGFEERASFRGWLTRIVKNRSLMRLRTAWRRLAMPIDAPNPGCENPTDDYASQDASPEQLYLDKELGVVLRKQVARMPRTYREPLEAVYLQGESVAKVCGRLGITNPGLKSRLHRGRLELRAIVAGQTAQEPG